MKQKLYKLMIAVLAVLLLSTVFAGVAAAEERTAQEAYVIGDGILYHPDQKLNYPTELPNRPYAEGRLIIQCDHSSYGTSIANSVTVLTDYTDLVSGMMLIETPNGMTVPEAVAYYRNLPGVIFAEPDYLHELPDEPPVSPNPPIVSFANSGSTPNDPELSKQWGLVTINAFDAWTTQTGSSDVVVAVLDTGINYVHEDLAENMWTDGSGHYGYDFVNEDNDPFDDKGHGTHCAGIIGAVGNNGKGISGVAWDVSLMAVKVLDENGGGFDSDIIEGIQYAAEHGADILSMSFGSYGYNVAVREAIESTHLLAVCSAGNDALDTKYSPAYPACYPSKNILAVAATTSDNQLVDFSNYGVVSIDVGAPGCDIYSTYIGSQSAYEYLSGTSMATPMVAGIAALVLSTNPELSAEEVKGLLMGSINPAAALSGYVATGGIVDAAKTLKNVAVPYYIVSFQDGYGNEISNQVVKGGDLLVRPEDPIRYFKVFDGWYADAVYQTPWDFSTLVTKSMTIYAKWTDVSAGIDTSWYDPALSEYILYTADELRGLSKLTYDMPVYSGSDSSTWPFYEKTIKLGADIDLNGENWIPIAVGGQQRFFGTFDGNGHTISNLYVNLPDESFVGLFGTTEGHVTNLTLIASSITGDTYVGTLAGLINTLNNVDVTVGSVTGSEYVGGLSGQRFLQIFAEEGPEADYNITVHVTGNIIGYKQCTGGIFGYGEGNNMAVTVDGCIDGCLYVGGAFGLTSSGFSNVSVKASAICSTQEGELGVNRDIGGIAGSCAGNINNCSAIIGSISGGTIGGLAGLYASMAISEEDTPELRDTGYVIKDIIVTMKGSGDGGGLIGELWETANGNYFKVRIENAQVTGNIKGWNYGGGIVGEIWNSDFDHGYSPYYVTIENCVSLMESLDGVGDIGSMYPTQNGRILGYIDGENVTTTFSDNYGWEGTTGYQGSLFVDSDYNGTSVSTPDVWNNQTFFQNLGWDFSQNWVMAEENDRYALPVLMNTAGVNTLDAGYLVDGLEVPIFLDSGLNESEEPQCVIATYGSSVLNPEILVNPKKTGYWFNGWYNETGEDGVQVINVSGKLNENVPGYTDENACWIKVSSSVTLYANWIEIPISAEKNAAKIEETTPESLPTLAVPFFTNPKSGKSIPLDDGVEVIAVIGGVEKTLPAKIIDGKVVLDNPDAVAGASSITVEFIGKKLGDSDGDGQVTVNDAVRVAQSLVNIVELNEKGEFYGDADSDGLVTVNDAVKVAQRLVDLVDENYE